MAEEVQEKTEITEWKDKEFCANVFLKFKENILHES
jgi:hypothetical protein